MLIEAARRAHTAAREMLVLVNAGGVSCAEMREMLAVTRAAVAVLSAVQTSAAAVVAGRERHGDGGAQVLADTAGLSQHDARSQVKTARVIETLPAVRDAVESGRVSKANARHLAEVIANTSAADVESDRDLLAKAESMRPEQFVREARRWSADHQPDGGESQFRRMRARRRVRIFDSDDNMVHLHGEFDPVTGKRIANRLRAEATRLYDTDKQHAKEDASNGGAERRSFDQCMADALDNLTNSTSSAGNRGGGKPMADICVIAHVDDDTGELIAELPDRTRLPAAVLDELACNARLTGVIYDRTGKPIWRSDSSRTVTKPQWQLLIAKWGGCFHCGANPAICQGHHIMPASRGGPTKLENLVPVCWTCHQRIHHQGWQILKHPDGNHTLHPPDHTRHGPARAPEPAPVLFNDSLGGDRALYPPDHVRHRPAHRPAQAPVLFNDSLQGNRALNPPDHGGHERARAPEPAPVLPTPDNPRQPRRQPHPQPAAPSRPPTRPRTRAATSPLTPDTPRQPRRPPNQVHHPPAQEPEPPPPHQHPTPQDSPGQPHP